MRLPPDRPSDGIDAVAVATGPSERPNRVRMTAAAAGERAGGRTGGRGSQRRARRSRRCSGDVAAVEGSRLAYGSGKSRRREDASYRLVRWSDRILFPEAAGTARSPLHDAVPGRRATAPCGDGVELAAPAGHRHDDDDVRRAPSGRREEDAWRRRHRDDDAAAAASGGDAGQAPAAATMERHAAASPIQSAHPHRLQAAHDYPPVPR